MDLQISDKRAVVTAGGRGMGAGMAKELADHGVKVAVIARSEKDIFETIERCGGSTRGHVGIALDLTAKSGPRKLIEELSRLSFGLPDIAVHNLGGTLEINDPYCSLDDWQKVWRINIEVAIELNLSFLPAMRAKKWGRIIHTSSISSVENHGPVPYCAVKAALNAYTRSMGRVVAPDGVVMSAILPGAIFTEGGYWDIASKDRPEHVAQYLKDRMAIHRFGDIQEVTKLVAFLASQHSSFCIGSIFPVDGGQGRGFFGY